MTKTERALRLFQQRVEAEERRRREAAAEMQRQAEQQQRTADTAGRTARKKHTRITKDGSCHSR